jgi:Kef-type K+ transport system membrane component KefB
LISEITPLLIVLAGAVLLLAAARLARRFGLPEGIGSGIAIVIGAIVIIMLSGRLASPAGIAQDRILTYGRMVGLTGLFFLAGTDFDFNELRGKAGYLFRITIIGAVVFAGAILAFRFLSHQDSGPAVLLAAAAVASSLCFSTQVPARSGRTQAQSDRQTSVVTLSALAVAAVYFFDIFQSTSLRHPSTTAYVVVAVYEALKLVLLFAFGYFICTRFLARAAGRVSKVRSTIGFALIAILIFALSFIAANQLIAVSWAFFAGTLWRSSIGAEFSEAEKPVASALFLAFVFLSLPLQLHGRSLTGVNALPIVFLVALVVKAGLVAFTIRSPRTKAAAESAIALGLPGETAILLLGFGLTRWPIDSAVFFTILGCALASALVIPAVRWLTNRRKTQTARTGSFGTRRWQT